MKLSRKGILRKLGFGAIGVMTAPSLLERVLPGGIGDEVELQAILDANPDKPLSWSEVQRTVAVPARRFVLNKPVVLRRSLHADFSNADIVRGAGLHADTPLVAIERGEVSGYFSPIDLLRTYRP